MATPPTQSIARTLPPEIIAHVFALAVEEPATTLRGVYDQRQTILAASEVCRSWSAEAFRLARFTITTERQAKALTASLAQLEERTVLEVATSRPGSVLPDRIRVRELILAQPEGVLGDWRSREAFSELVNACPYLVSLAWWDKRCPLDEFVEGMSTPSLNQTLRRLRLVGAIVNMSKLLSCLERFPSLEALDLSKCSLRFFGAVVDDTPPAPLPSLRDLRVGFSLAPLLGLLDIVFISTVLHSATSLRSLTITNVHLGLLRLLPPLSVALAAVAPNLVHFACEPQRTRRNHLKPIRNHHEKDETLSLLRTMKNLETLAIPLLPNLAFFTALRTLPRLTHLRVFVVSPIDATKVSSSLAHASFRSLELTMATTAAWDEEGVKMVRKAAEAAGLRFRYEVSRG